MYLLHHIQCKSNETRCELVQLIPRVTSPSATRPRPAFKVRKTLCVLGTHGTPQQTCDVILLLSPKLRPSDHLLPSIPIILYRRQYIYRCLYKYITNKG